MKQYLHNLSGTIVNVISHTTYNDQGTERTAAVIQAPNGTTCISDLGSFLSRHTLKEEISLE